MKNSFLNRCNFKTPIEFVLLFCCLCIGHNGFTQTRKIVADSLVVRKAPFGYYLDLGKLPAINTGYKVFRKGPEGTENLIGSFVPSKNLTEFSFQLNAHAQVLRQYGPIKMQLAEQFWLMYTSADRDRILTGDEFPPLHLAVGATFADTTADVQNSYSYRVQFDNGRELKAQAFKNGTVQNYAPVRIRMADPGNKQVSIEWQTLAKGVAPYWVVKRRDVSGLFEEIFPERGIRRENQDSDSLIYLVVDSLIHPGITYDYFLQMKDALGNDANRSDTVRIEVGGRDNVEHIRNLNSIADTSGIRLTWDSLQGDHSIRSIVVLRSEKYDFGYEVIATLPVNSSDYLDQQVIGGTNYYYQLIAEGSFNFSLPTPRVSGMFFGQQPFNQVPVQEIYAKGIANGVELSWNYPDSTIAGFRVFRAQQREDQNYQQISDVISVESSIKSFKDALEFQYIDTLSLAAGTKYYYRIVPVSRSYINGMTSEAVGATPLALGFVPLPGTLRAIVQDSVVHLAWPDLQNVDSKIVGYWVYKKSDQSDTFSDKHALKRVVTNGFQDTLKSGEKVWYSIRSLSISGDRSDFTDPLVVQISQDQPLPPGTVRAYLQENSIVIAWDGEVQGAAQNYKVYRATGSGSYTVLKDLPANQENMLFQDMDVKKGQVYYYYLTSVNKAGQESRRSREVIIQVP